jgi:hypothetical protein
MYRRSGYIVRGRSQIIKVAAPARPMKEMTKCRERTPPGPEEQRMASFLRVYPPCVDEASAAGPQATVCVRLADLLPLVALAYRQNYLWLQDFLDDEVVITDDLHEVLRAFRCTRPSA